MEISHNLAFADVCTGAEHFLMTKFLVVSQEYSRIQDHFQSDPGPTVLPVFCHLSFIPLPSTQIRESNS